MSEHPAELPMADGDAGDHSVNSDASVRSRQSPWRRAARRFAHQPAGLIGATLVSFYAVAAIAAPLLAPFDPLDPIRGQTLVSPNSQFWLGTDPLGRDLLSRIIYGTRTALTIGLLAVAVGGSIGALSGFVAGYIKNALGSVIMRLWDAVFALPAVLIGITLAAAFGGGAVVAAVALGIAAAPQLARISYSALIAELEKGYVESARSLGFNQRRIFFLHLIPNAIGPVIVQLALTMGIAVLLESILSFLGVGIQPPTPSWGAMLADSRNFLSRGWWYAIFPGLAITGLILALNLTADAARDALDPRSERT